MLVVKMVSSSAITNGLTRQTIIIKLAQVTFLSKEGVDSPNVKIHINATNKYGADIGDIDIN